MSARRRIRILVALLLGAAVAACDAGRLSDAGQAGATHLSLHISAADIPIGDGGVADAFHKATEVRIVLMQGATTRFDQTFTVDATSGEINVPLAINLNAASESFAMTVTLGTATAPLFLGNTEVQLRAGESSPVNIALTPVPAAVAIREPGPILISTYGATTQLHATVLFATGDTIPGLDVAFSSLDPTVATSSTAGLVTGLTEGNAPVVAALGGVADTVIVRVHAHVATVTIQPVVDTITVGGSTTLTATPTDGGGHPVPGRHVTWTSVDSTIARVDTTGVVTGVRPGTTTIVAIVDSASSSTTIVVTYPAPTALTDPVGTISGDAAVLNGRVNPNGLAATAWFEWSKDTTSFKSATSSKPQSVGSGTSLVQVTFTAGGLAGGAEYIYRMAAGNGTGTSYGGPVHFTTPPRAPTAITDSANVSSDYYTINFFGTVVPNGLATTAYIEVGYDPSFVEYTIVGEVAIPAGSDPVQIVGSLPNYGNTYWYRTVAANSMGQYADASKSITGPAVGSVPIGTAGQRTPAGKH